ncbi:MAG: hypothetical protein VX777_05930 [Chlamydiota bacterium]|nr:hypothetical protein [Chlamydiota bacterium]
MYTGQSRKNKIHLTDYDFESDISRRLFLNQLNLFEIEVFREVIFNSLKFPLSELAQSLETSNDKIRKALEKIEPTNLFQIENDNILVNKELRKYFETQIERFDSDFTPDIDFFHSLLHHVPIHILPTWFSIPKSSNDIFCSIVDKYLYSPKLFSKYLLELNFDDDRIPKIIDLIYQSPNLSMDVSELLEHFPMSRDELEVIILTLEFHCVCCLNYISEGDNWKQVVEPFSEWRQYQQTIRSSLCSPIENQDAVEIFREGDFPFAQDLNSILIEISESPLSLEKICARFGEQYANQLVNKIVSLKIGYIKNNQLHETENTVFWKDKPVQEKAMSLYFSTIHFYRKKLNENNYTDRDIREVEKSLKPIMGKGWILLNDFIFSMIAPLGDCDEVTLCKKGRQWMYSLPDYSEDQIAFITSIVENHLFESGIVCLGTYGKEKCLCVTPFGQLSLGDE